MKALLLAKLIFVVFSLSLPSVWCFISLYKAPPYRLAVLSINLLEELWSNVAAKLSLKYIAPPSPIALLLFNITTELFANFMMDRETQTAPPCSAVLLKNVTGMFPSSVTSE